MKKSPKVVLTIMAGVGAAIAGGAFLANAGSDDDQRTQTASADWGDDDGENSRYCADSTGRVVPDEECARPRPVGSGFPFLYYYGARTLMGNPAGGATYITGGRPSTVGVGSGVVTPRAVTRGGFGRTAGRTSGISVRS